MANGWQMATENVGRFEAWTREHRERGDWPRDARSGKLNRSEIAAECGFGRSVFGQNPAVRDLLFKLEDDLRREGILLAPCTGTTQVEKSTGRDARTIAIQERRIRDLEAERRSLRERVDELERLLPRYDLIDRHMRETGRLLRP